MWNDAGVGKPLAPEPVPVFGRDQELATVGWMLEGLKQSLGRVLILDGEAGILR